MHAPVRHRRRGPRLAALLWGLAASASAGCGLWEGLWGAAAPAGVLTHAVRRGDLEIVVVEDGNVESASNIDVKCMVPFGTTIKWIITDGSHVKKGDKLVELDSAALDEQVNQQRIVYEKAQAAKIQAERDFSAAQIAVEEYLQGTFVKELQAVEAQITIALENLRTAENALAHAERMARKGYISALQREAQAFAVQKARLDLQTAETSKMVLEKFTKLKMLEDLQSKRDSAEARMRSEQAAFELERAKLDRLERDLAACLITAPQDGMVVFANDRGSRFGGGDGPRIEEGAPVREGQTLIRLPDLSRMQVRVTVHESKVDLLRPGMPATISIQNRRFTGQVATVANQPEPTSFFSSNVKEYAATVRIDDAENLRPGMTAQVEILVARHEDVLSVPVQAILEQRGQYLCWRVRGAHYERRPVVLGATNAAFIEIRDGLVEGDVVVLNPRAVVPEAREGAAAEPIEASDGPRRRGRGGKPNGEAPPAEGTVAPLGAGPLAGGAPAAGGAPPAALGPGGPRTGGGTPGLADWDRDGDQRISREEAPERLRPAFDRLDANGDGFLDAGELAAARARAPRPGAAVASEGPPASE